MDCTPRLTRFTRPAAYASTSSGVIVSGLHSTVVSQPAERGTASSTATRSAAGTRDGVPPPTKMLVAGGIPAATARSMSARHASR